MRAKTAILLSLAGFMSPLWAEEIQWRPAVPRAEQAASPSASTPSASTPNTVSASGESTRCVSLARPVALPATEQKPGDPRLTPVDFRPVPVTRSRSEDNRFSSPLPSGPIIAGTAQGSGTQNGAQNGAQNGKSAPKDKSEPPEEIPTAPTPLPPSSESMIMPLDDGGMMVTGDGFGPGFPFFLGGVGPRNYFYVSAEYLLWTIRQDNVTPLLTSGNLNNIDSAVLYGNDQLAGPGRNGGRFTVGFWCPCYPDIGVEVVGTFLGQRTSSFTANGTMFVPLGNNTPLLTLTNGSFAATSTSELWGIEANARYKWYQGPILWVDCLLGYRNLSLNESLSIYNQSRGGGALPSFGTIRTLDQFSTTNSYNAIQAGAEFNWNFLRYFTLGGFVKLGLGNVSQSLSINGISDANGQPGGLHALSSNIGNYSRNDFGIMPDLGVKLGWNPTDRIKLFVGYEFLYLNSVMRVGEQVDGRIDTGLLPNQRRAGPLANPRPLLTQSTFWAQGVNFGVIFNW